MGVFGKMIILSWKCNEVGGVVKLLLNCKVKGLAHVRTSKTSHQWVRLVLHNQSRKGKVLSNPLSVKAGPGTVVLTHLNEARM